MSEKSYVSMEQHVCGVCGAVYDTNNLLLDKRFRNTLERNTVTGYGLCPEHEKLHQDGYIALVECSNRGEGAVLSCREAKPTGRIAHIKKAVAKDVFNCDLGDEPVVFVEAPHDGKKGVIDVLRDMQERAAGQ